MTWKLEFPKKRIRMTFKIIQIMWLIYFLQKTVKLVENPMKKKLSSELEYFQTICIIFYFTGEWRYLFLVELKQIFICVHIWSYTGINVY